MFALWVLFLASTVSSSDTEAPTAPITNVTTLYPVSNKTITRNDTQTRVNVTTTPRPQTWKIESSFAESNLTEVESNATDADIGKEKKEMLTDFKPSQHLGSFFDEDSAEVIKTPAFGPVEKKPASGFVSSPKDEYQKPAFYDIPAEIYHKPPSNYIPTETYNPTFNDQSKEVYHSSTFNKIPKKIYQTHQPFPYKFEDTIYTKTKWRDSMESKPTVESPVKVPAGGIYKSPELFKEKPHNDEEFGLEFHDGGKENGVNKRVNPWQNLLRMLTAFIPVGLIISALTPSVITIHDVDDKLKPSSLPYRRSDTGMSDMAPISEPCRRRLLCELHSERNYVPPSSVPRRNMKHCYKIYCEDTDALWRMLRWLFTYNAGDERGRHLT